MFSSYMRESGKAKWGHRDTGTRGLSKMICALGVAAEGAAGEPPPTVGGRVVETGIAQVELAPQEFRFHVVPSLGGEGEEMYPTLAFLFGHLAVGPHQLVSEVDHRGARPVSRPLHVPNHILGKHTWRPDTGGMHGFPKTVFGVPGQCR